MKKVFFMAAAASIMISQTGCFGSFALVKKVYELNQDVSDNKIVQTLVFYVFNIIPVYGIASFVDVIVLNLIEFWTGSNPLALKPGETEEQLLTIKGESYKLTATKNKLNFEKVVDGNLVDMGAMVYSTDHSTWNFEKDGLSQELIKINPDQTVDFNTLAGMQTFGLNSTKAFFASNSSVNYSSN